MGKLSGIRFFKDQWSDLELASADLTGKTVIITGANVGLGFETAKHIARMEPTKLILGCRDMKKAENAVHGNRIPEIRTATQIGDELVAWHIDQASFSSVVAFVEKFEAEGGGRLDLLIANAGMFPANFVKTSDGYEQGIHVNNLSTSLLALLLLPTQIKTASSGPTPRLVILSSHAHHLAVPFKDGLDPKIIQRLSDETYCTPSRMKNRYNISKCTSIFCIQHLPEDTPLTVVAVHPGLCYSKLGRNESVAQKIMYSGLRRLVGRTTEMGSRPIVWGAVGGEKKSIHGKYLDSCRVEEENDWVFGKDGKIMQDNAWNGTLEILRSVSPQVDAIVAEYLTRT
ncbi:short-chain dehydrogenase [Hysterangium stoloniferum]|nr:short-chain dehydrogenase [Hysterangium stoloniferum]